VKRMTTLVAIVGVAVAATPAVASANDDEHFYAGKFEGGGALFVHQRDSALSRVVVHRIPVTCRFKTGEARDSAVSYALMDVPVEDGRVKYRREAKAGAPPAYKYRTVVSGPVSPGDARLTIRHRSKQRKPPRGFQRCLSGPLDVELRQVSKQRYRSGVERAGFGSNVTPGRPFRG
jgi:hypothetical protein